MKRAIIIGLLLGLLAGCAAPQAVDVFTVDDTLLQEPAALFTIVFAVPTDAVLSVSSDDGLSRCYTAEDGRYTIQTAVRPGVDAQQVLREMTGFSEQELSPIQTSRMGMTQYRFSWCSSDDSGVWICAGAVLEDADACYCLSFSMPEACARDCRALQMQVLDSFSLFEDEGF